MSSLLLAALVWAAPARAAAPAEHEASARLEARVGAALEGMLGPGRSALAVEARGQRVVKREVSEMSGVNRGDQVSAPRPAARVIDLPGYTKPGAPPAPAPAPGGIVHVLKEETESEQSFAVTGIRAWLVLDSAVDDAAAEEAARVAGRMLGLDPVRGDELAVIRTSFAPSWRAAFSRPRDARALALVSLAAAALLLAALLLARAATRSSETFASALASRAPEAPAPPRVSAARRIELLPRLGSPLVPPQGGPEEP